MRVAAIVGLLAIIVLLIYYESQQSNCAPSGCAGTGANCVGTCCCNITNEPCSWPTGDNIWTMCRAIAMAEGANISGSKPDRLNNPGDLTDDFVSYGGSCGITHFPSKKAGWLALYNKVNEWVEGTSTTYPPNSTWAQIAKIYAGPKGCCSSNWLENVTSILGVSPDSTPGEYV